MNWSRVRTPLSVAALALSSFACRDDGITGVQLNELNRAQSRWASIGYAGQRYLMQQQLVCFCPDANLTYEVTVSGGLVARAVSPATGGPLPDAQLVRFRSVEQLFAELRNGLRSGAVVEVAYDALTGYPAIVSLDPVRNAVDDEVVYRTSNVTPIR